MTLVHVPSDGLSLAVETFGQGPPLIFAHGLTGNRHVTRAQLAPLADHYRVITYDQRGHGDSTPVTQADLYDPHRMAEDITAILDALGIDRAFVGGESMGAATALLFTLAHPDRAQALLLTAPAFSDQLNPESQRLHAMAAAISTFGIDKFLEQAAVRQRDDLGWPPVAIAHVRNTFSSHDSNSLVVALHTVADWQLSLAPIQYPACILAWHDDPLHPYALAKRIAALLSNAQLHTLAPLPAIFEQPTLIASAYSEFLSGVTA